MNKRKSGYRSKLSESLAKDGAVPTVPTVPTGLEEVYARGFHNGSGQSASRAHHGISKKSGYSGYSGYSLDKTASSKADCAVPTFQVPALKSGYSGYTLHTDRTSLEAALRLPVRHLPWARLTYHLSHALGEVAWTTVPGVYEALRGSCAAFSPKEFQAAVAGGETQVASARRFAEWVAKKLAMPTWRLGVEEALLWGPRARIAACWWPGAEWCDAHELRPETGWTVGYACARFELTPVSVEVHREEQANAA